MSDSKYILRPMKWELYPVEHGRMSDFVTEIVINDEGDGEFVTIAQPLAANGNGVSVVLHEWDVLRQAVDQVFAQIEQFKEGAR